MPSVFFHRCDTSTSLPSTSRVTYPADMVPWNTPTVPSPGCPEYNTAYHPCTYLFRICVMPSISLPLALSVSPSALALMGIGWLIAKNANPRTFVGALYSFVPAGIMFGAGLFGMGLGALRIVFTALATQVSALWGSQ